MNDETPGAGLVSSSAAAESEADELCCLSGDKPFFDIVLSKSHVTHPNYLAVPSSMFLIFPRRTVPMVLTLGDKNWNMSYHGAAKRLRFDYTGWRRFVVDNNLKSGDACIFEVMESSRTILRLRVVILRDTNDVPPELDAVVDSHGMTLETAGPGTTPETAIELD